MRRLLPLALLAACTSPPPAGLMAAEDGPGPHVKFDVFHRPLPEIPLPNDFATTVDGNSPTRRRLNAAIEVAPTQWEKRTRAVLDEISGWGTLAPITVSFSETLDVKDLASRHQRPADTADDALYVIDVTEGSPEKCEPVLLDVGQGHFPTVLDRREYYPDDPHQSMEQLVFEQEEEDLDGDGELDPGEDTDMDGVLDHPNVLDPGISGPFDVMSFYERETNTIIAKPLYPMRSATTYAVVLTTRLKGVDGNRIRSPFGAINHAMQTKWLEPLPKCLEGLGLTLDDVAFTWTFTTQDVHADTIAVREGLYGRGTLGWLGEQFPAKINALENIRRATSRTTNVNIVPGADFRALGARLFEFYGGGGTGAGTKKVLDDALSFVDFYTVGNIVSPQLFPRQDPQGKDLALYDQVWDVKPATGYAFTRPEEVSFFAAAPTGRNGKPAPVVIFVHGHSGSKLDSLIMMGPMARFGLATVGIDAVSHGIGVDATLQEVINGIVEPYGLTPMTKALMKGRAIDHDGDGIVDSGADYWSAYVMHTRDVVRQTAIDQMQMVRVLRSFDGVRTWDFDVNKDGQNDIAGDFDGDGKVDLGGPDTPIYLAGASLGGILSSLVGGLEPEVDAMVPILPGGYLSEVGLRSNLGQVRNAMILRMMAPLMLVRDGALTMMVPNKHVEDAEKKLADMPELQAGSIAVARNLKTGEWRCGRVQHNRHLRVAVPSDDQDPLQLELYNEELPTRKREGCETEGFTPWKVVNTFEHEVVFAGKTYAAGSKLVALGDGYGLRRGSPDLRRLLALAQIGLEAADPANVAPNYEGTRTLTMGDGSVVATRALMVPMTGDPGVPIAAATALMRAAGLLDYKNIDPRYGKTQMQELIDTGFVEGVERTGRWKDSTGKNVLMDVDVLQSVAMADDGFGVPRLNPPMRLLRNSEKLGGKPVGGLFPMMNPQGDHSFPVPDPDQPFDLGMLLINIFGNYLANGDVPLDKCMEDTTCTWIRPVQ